MEQERVIELCESYAPVAKIVEIVGQGAVGLPHHIMAEFLIKLVADLQEAGALPIRQNPRSVEVVDVSVAQ